MFDKVLRQMREKVRERQYIVTLHADEEMANDDLSIFDVERVILTGKIRERQKDPETVEWKYRILGHGVGDRTIVVVAKIGITGKLVIITTYAS